LIPAAAVPVGTVKKPSVVCEALFKPLWESAFFADFHQGRQFPQAFRRPFFLFLCLFPLFPKKISRQDRLATTIRPLDRPTTSWVLSLHSSLATFLLF
jgi:hypothetical protein